MRSRAKGFGFLFVIACFVVFAANIKDYYDRAMALEKEKESLANYGESYQLSEPSRINGGEVIITEIDDVNDYAVSDEIDTSDYYSACRSLSYFDTDIIPMVEINNNEPFFYSSDLTTTSYESYSELDGLGRVQSCIACLCLDTMPAEDEVRGDISNVYPSGYENAQYDGIDEYGWLYNRCHCIAWCLSAENDNERNLITGTRFFNTEGMLPFESDVADYIRITGHHVLYRVTPIYRGDELVCRGVLMEAYSVEDSGALSFCAYVPNIQPGISIDYATGYSSGPEYTGN